MSETPTCPVCGNEYAPRHDGWKQVCLCDLSAVHYSKRETHECEWCGETIDPLEMSEHNTLAEHMDAPWLEPMSETRPNLFGISMEEAAQGFRAMASAVRILERDPSYQFTVRLAWAIRCREMSFIRKCEWMVKTGKWPRAESCPLLSDSGVKA